MATCKTVEVVASLRAFKFSSFNAKPGLTDTHANAGMHIWDAN